MGQERDPPDLELARIAGRQHGVVSIEQLRRAGISAKATSARVRRGQLHRLHRGVYLVGHGEPSREARWMGAVLACGEGAVLSHASAAALWGLLREVDGPVDVSVPVHSGRRGHREVRLHRCPSLATASLRRAEGEPPLAARTRRDGIPVTAPWRTIDDLGGVVPPRLYRRAVREAELRRLALAPRTPLDRTRSELERDFLALCRAHGLPAPEVNVRLGRWTVDFVWPAERLAVETDSWATHAGGVAFEDDHQRDLELRARGYEVRRYTDLQLRARPEAVAADLRARLSSPRRGPRGTAQLDV